MSRPKRQRDGIIIFELFLLISLKKHPFNFMTDSQSSSHISSVGVLFYYQIEFIKLLLSKRNHARVPPFWMTLT